MKAIRRKMSRRAGVGDKTLSRRHVAISLIVAGVVFSIPAIGLGGGTTSPPRILVDQATELHAQETAAGRVALLSTRTTDGQNCMVLHLLDLGQSAPQDLTNGGSLCSRPEAQSVPITTELTWIPAGTRFAIVISGHVSDSISRLELTAGQRTVRVPLRSGFYLANTVSAVRDRLPDTSAYFVVGYDRAGREVARLDLQSVIAAATPNRG
jgi:hypothetical protein